MDQDGAFYGGAVFGKKSIGSSHRPRLFSPFRLGKPASAHPCRGLLLWLELQIQRSSEYPLARIANLEWMPALQCQFDASGLQYLLLQSSLQTIYKVSPKVSEAARRPSMTTSVTRSANAEL